MHRCTQVIVVIAAALGAGCAGSVGYSATVSSAGYGPDLVYVAPGVQVIADYDEPIFYADNFYWRYDGSTWYRSSYYTGGWVYATPPALVRRIERPQRYVHYRPRGWVPHRAPVQRGPVVRDHRAPAQPGPVVRDHRAPVQPGPVVRDHRAPVQPGPVVRDHRENRPPIERRQPNKQPSPPRAAPRPPHEASRPQQHATPPSRERPSTPAPKARGRNDGRDDRK